MNDFNSIPFVVLRSKKRSKTISIAIDPSRGIILHVPQSTIDTEIIRILKVRESWILGKWSDSRYKILQSKKTVFANGGQILFLGKYYTLEIFPFSAKRNQCEIIDETLLIRLKVHDSLLREALAKRILEKWFRVQAEAILIERTQYFSETMNLEPRQIIVKSQKNIWGSCSRDNTIRYNWKIVMAESDLIDYLVVHELAHIIEKNHSTNFWKLVATILPDYNARRKKLKNFQVGEWV